MKKKISLLLMLCMVLAGCGKSSSDTGNDEIVLQDNQSLTYGQVTKINGNELTIALAKEVSMSEMQSQKGNRGQSSSKTEQSSQPSASEQPSGNASENSSDGAGEKASGSSSTDNAGGGTPPDMNGGSTDNAGGGTPPDMNGGSTDSAGGGTPPDMNGGSSDNAGGSSSSSAGKDKSKGSTDSKTDSSSKQTSKDNDTSNKVMYQLTGEEETVTIPVGTTVTTSLGAKTTFSRIAVDDTLKLLMQKDDNGNEIIVGVWIVA